MSDNKELVASKVVHITVIQYGDDIYPLLKEIPATLAPVGSGYLFYADLLPSIVGHGYTSTGAFMEWQLMFHWLFQELHCKLHWERTPEQNVLYQLLCSIVDVETHLANTHLSLQQTGKITAVNLAKNKRTILWLDGSADSVALTKNAPAELQLYNIGDFFCASILRDRITGKLIEIKAVSDTSHTEDMCSDEEMGAFLNSLPTSAGLPVSSAW